MLNLSFVSDISGNNSSSAIVGGDIVEDHLKILLRACSQHNVNACLGESKSGSAADARASSGYDGCQAM